MVLVDLLEVRLGLRIALAIDGQARGRVERAQVPRPQPQDLVEADTALVGPPELPEHLAEIEPGVREGAVDVDGLAELGFRLLVVAHAIVRATQPVEGAHLVREGAEDVLEDLPGPVEVELGRQLAKGQRAVAEPDVRVHAVDARAEHRVVQLELVASHPVEDDVELLGARDEGRVRAELRRALAVVEAEHQRLEEVEHRLVEVVLLVRLLVALEEDGAEEGAPAQVVRLGLDRSPIQAEVVLEDQDAGPRLQARDHGQRQADHDRCLARRELVDQPDDQHGREDHGEVQEAIRDGEGARRLDLQEQEHEGGRDRQQHAQGELTLLPDRGAERGEPDQRGHDRHGPGSIAVGQNRPYLPEEARVAVDEQGLEETTEDLDAQLHLAPEIESEPGRGLVEAGEDRPVGDHAPDHVEQGAHGPRRVGAQEVEQALGAAQLQVPEGEVDRERHDRNDQRRFLEEQADQQEHARSPGHPAQATLAPGEVALEGEQREQR